MNNMIEQKPYVDDYGIYMPEKPPYEYRCVMTKDVFVEAYNKWIKHTANGFTCEDDADCWCE